MNNADGYVVIGTKLDTKTFNGDLARLEADLKTKITGMTSLVTNAFSRLKRTLLSLGIGAIIIGMFNFDDAVKRVDALNNFPRVMSNLGISAKDAEASMKRMSDALLGLPTTLDEATLSVQRFTSANGNVKASTEMFLALNNAILAGGASTQVQSTALEQLSQAYAKGKPDMMEWRSAMTAMPAQLKQVAMAMGYASSSDLGEALRSGTVSMNEFMATIVKLNKQGVNGFKSFDEQARNSTGGIATSLRNLKTTFTRAFADILNAVGQSNIAAFFDKIKNAIIAVTPYIAGFVKAILMLFGINNKKQADDTAASFNNLGASVSSTTDDLDDATGAAKSLNKELKGLSSFDEMNVLPDKSSSDSGGGAGVSGGVGGGLGDLDFGDFETNLNDVADKTQEIANKITKFLKPIVDHWKEIAGAILGARAAISLFEAGWGGLESLGIGLIIAGITTAVLALISYLKDPTWKNFGTFIQGLGTALVGLGIIIGMVAGGWIVALIGAIVLLWGTIVKYWDKIQAFLQKGIDWLFNQSDTIHRVFGDTIGSIYDNVVATLQDILNWAGRMMDRIKANFDEIISFVKNVFAGNWKAVWQNVKNIFKNIWDGMKDTAVTAFNAILTVAKNIGIGVGNVIASAFKNVVNSVLRAIENVLNTPIRTINSLIGVVNKIPGINLGKLSTFNLPRLAKGGIINMPGRGIPVGSAIAAENGREAVLPLTDTQQMQLLGEAIGRYITLNATIPVQIGNRLVAREIKRINAENDFAFNR